VRADSSTGRATDS